MHPDRDVHARSHFPTWIPSGRLIVVSLATVALAAAALSWNYRRASMRQAMAFWGPRVATLVARAEGVELIRLDPRRASELGASWGTRREPPSDLAEAATRDIRTAPGLAHLRRALIEDASFDWTASVGATPPHLDYALRLFDDDSSATLLFSIRDECVARADRWVFVSVTPIAEGLATFFSEQFPAAFPDRSR